MTRNEQIAAFLAEHGFVASRLVPLAQDASFRRYWRVTDGPWPAVLMDAPPPEDTSPFLRVAMHLAGLGLSVPVVRAADTDHGLLLEEDLGDAIYSVVLTAENQTRLFDAAVDALVVMHRARPPAGSPAGLPGRGLPGSGLPGSGLPDWGPAEMAATALGTLLDWWWPAMFAAPAPAAARADFAAALEALLAPLADGPSGFVHRDFFAGNLLWLPDRDGVRRVGILDFQSAALGHPAYDLASLVQDARRDMPGPLAARCADRYLAARPELDSASFRVALAVCAAQRHLRVAGQWVRLARRDNKPHYLAHGPRTWGLLAAALAAPQAAPFAAPLTAVLDRWIPAEYRRNPPDPAP